MFAIPMTAIIPMKDLKDTVALEKKCAENDYVYVTKNGYGKLVVMDMDYFQKVMGEFMLSLAIKEGLDDIKASRVIDGKTVFEELGKKYGFDLK